MQNIKKIKKSRFQKINLTNRKAKMITLVVAFAIVGAVVFLKSFAAPIDGQITGQTGYLDWVCGFRNYGWASSSKCPGARDGYFVMDERPYRNTGFDSSNNQESSWNTNQSGAAFYSTNDNYKFESAQQYKICAKARTPNGETFLDVKPKVKGSPTLTINFPDRKTFNTYCSKEFTVKVQDDIELTHIDLQLPVQFGSVSPYDGYKSTDFNKSRGSLEIQSLTLYRNPGWIESRTYGSDLTVVSTTFPKDVKVADREYCTAPPSEPVQMFGSEQRGAYFSCPAGTGGHIQGRGSYLPVKVGKTYKICSKIHGSFSGSPKLITGNWGADYSTSNKESSAGFSNIEGTNDYIACTDEVVSTRNAYIGARIESTLSNRFKGGVFYITALEKI